MGVGVLYDFARVARVHAPLVGETVACTHGEVQAGAAGVHAAVAGIRRGYGRVVKSAEKEFSYNRQTNI